ncbi:MAG: phospho-N-acetylmuramoyl-pentapeptide-transferase, partial [Trebonia sp.]
ATTLGIVGFLDDFLKIRKQRNLGLNKTAKSVGLLLAAVLFGILVMQFANGEGLTPASVNLSFVRDIPAISFGVVGFVLFAVVVIEAWANAVNFTDGLDGLAGGSSAMVLATYVVITFFQNGHDCTARVAAGCFYVRDPLDLALVSAAALGACAGFLWWNAAPAKIFMGDTGSLALGGALAGLAIVTRTDLLLLLLGGLFVIITMSVVIQVGSYKLRHKRVFKMAPLQHHFELVGWAETTIVVRFWLIAGMFVALGLGIFYVGWFPK